MKIVLDVSEDTLNRMEQLLKKSNRTLKNYIESLYLTVLKTHESGSTMLMINELGLVNKTPNP